MCPKVRFAGRVRFVAPHRIVPLQTILSDCRLTLVLPGTTIIVHGAICKSLMTVKSSVSLTDEQHAFAKDLVQVGRYSSVSAVLQRGIDMLRQRLEREEMETDALKLLLARRRDGDFITGTRMDARIKEMVGRKHRAHEVLD